MARVRRAAAARGKKTELAKVLGVPLAGVSQWLSLRRAPNGEITLLMQQWVTAQEQNKKAPGRVSRTAKGKTRSTHQTYEGKTRKTGPRAR
jgi:hypothetical protein